MVESVRTSMEATAEESRRLRGILDTSPVGVAISVDGTFRFANPRFEELLQLRAGDRAADSYLDAADRDVVLDQLARDGIVRDLELKARNAQGEVRDERARRRDHRHRKKKEEPCSHDATSSRGTRRAARSFAERARGLAACSSSPGTTGFLVIGSSRASPRKACLTMRSSIE